MNSGAGRTVPGAGNAMRGAPRVTPVPRPRIRPAANAAVNGDEIAFGNHWAGFAINVRLGYDDSHVRTVRTPKPDGVGGSAVISRRRSPQGLDRSEAFQIKIIDENENIIIK